MKLELIRSYLPDRTVGYIVAPGGGCYGKTLERPWLNNERNVSCIPEGTYTVRRDRAGRFRFFAIDGVSGRSHIEMHKGVFPTNSDGCVLVQSGHTDEYNLTGDTNALDVMVNVMGNDDWTLVIRSFNPAFDVWPE